MVARSQLRASVLRLALRLALRWCCGDSITGTLHCTSASLQEWRDWHLECHWHRAPECGLARQAALASERARRAPGNRKATVQTPGGAVQVQVMPVASLPVTSSLSPGAEVLQARRCGAARIQDRIARPPAGTAAPLVSRWTIPGEAGMQGLAPGPWGSCQCFEAELRLPVADLPRVNFCARIRLERQWHQSVGVCDCRCLDTLSR